jgi:predicted nucleic acid-binding protein
MRRGKFQVGLFQTVFDSSSLINIKNKHKMNTIRSCVGDIIIPQKVANELTCAEVPRSDPLCKFFTNYPAVVVQFNGNEEIEYLRIRSQVGIHDADAAAITLAMARNLPLVIDDRKARNKAQNHGVYVLGSEDFVNRQS